MQAQRLRWMLAFAMLLLAGSVGQAIITAKTPLAGQIASVSYVVVVKVEQFHPDKLNMVLTVEEDLKGKLGPRRLSMVLKGDSEAEKLNHVPMLLKRLAPDLPLVLFITQRAKTYNGFAYTNGTWFQFIGNQTDKDRAVLSLTHGEPYLRRTFRGTTAEMRRVVQEAIKDKKAAPEPDESVEPGFGPEVMPEKKTSATPSRSPWASAGASPQVTPALAQGERRHGFAPFALIPTVGMAPLAILAALFPSVFGGVLVLFRQWMAFLVVLSVNSTALLVYQLWGGARGSWWSTPAAIWLGMTAVTLLGAIWAWRRQVHRLSMGPSAPDAPARTELVFLCSLFVSLAGCLIFFAFQKPGRFDLGWNLLIVLTAGVGAAMLWKLYRTFIPSRSLLLPRSTEGIVLSIALLPSILYAGLRQTVVQFGSSGEVQVRWQFAPGGDEYKGFFASSPLIAGDRIFIAAAHPNIKGGTLFCLNRWTGAKAWDEDFLGDGLFKQVFSSPTLVDGRLYIGEGFHDDLNCRLYCIDAATGKQIWAFPTTGQVESSPVVVDGKVYFGGGNDGFYCLDARTAKKLWLFPPDPSKGRLLRFGATALVTQGKVFVGTGVDRNRPADPGEMAVFCLDAANGGMLWKRGVDLPAWAAPVLEGERLYVTLGNGDVFSDAADAAPAGAALCLNAATGEVFWRTPIPNGVLERPALDEKSMYFGSRDGRCYCLDKTDGRIVWKTDLGSPVIAAVALARSGGQTRGVYAVSDEGKIACLHPRTGQELWNHALSGQVHVASSPRVIAEIFPEGERHHIFIAAGLGDIAGGNSQAALLCLERRVPGE